MSQKFANNATSRLVGNISAAATGFTVTTGEGTVFPSIGVTDYVTDGHHFLCTLESALGVKEIVKVTSRVGDIFTIERAQESTVASAFSVGDLVELRLTAGFIDVIKKGSIIYVIDGGGAVIETGIKGFIEAPFGGSITSVRAFADQVGDISVDILKDTYAAYPPEAAWDSICNPVGGAGPGQNPVAINAADKAKDGTNFDMTSWLKTFNAQDIFAFNVVSLPAPSVIKRVTISITVDRN